ncbi:hypothetical protein PLESTF_000895000 [Pleodorina starrii]|nr:hypothetical protein PLESTM_002050300 [Pleodorina starrii]GLC69911.1 hypothetical protein PLESTF_000895000 [Pleodorina starrii]
MARPRSNNKVSKQRAGAGSGKRKLGDAPHAGGAGSRPAKQSRRESRSKRVAQDVYEAEDSDPDEVKHSERFDKVDNYEYELPSDFEDEEIDEELAFTEEDKKKFGAWFGKEVSSDEGEEGAGIGDDDGEDWDDDDEGEGADDADGAGEADDDDLLLGDDDDADGDLDGLEDEDDEGGDGDGDEDDERHRAMLEDILGAADGGGGGARKRARRNPNAAVVSEAYPESEYNLNPGAASAGGAVAGTLSIADLLQGLTGEERRKLGAARRLLEKVAGAGGAGAGADGGKGAIRPVAVPLPSVVAERQERKAGYEAAAEDVTKWQSIVKANREAPTLRLVSGRNEVSRVSTTAALVAQHVPSADNALEAEVAALLEAAGADSTKAIEEAEEQLALKALSLEEAKERRERLAKMRSLLFYHELKARRLKAIKSKEYHRHLARAAKRKATKLAALGAEGGGEGDVDAERAAAIEAEYQRAKERLTQRHRNSSRWARRALKRGQLQVDAGTKAALAEQLQLGQQLKRKIEGKKGSGDSDDDDSDASTSASDDEGGEGNGADKPNRVRSAALELLAGGGPLDLDGENAPKKGLLALPFMKRAMERRKLQAQQEAEQLLKELDEQEHLRQQEDEEEDGGGGGDAARQAADGKGEAGGGAGLLAALVGYGVPGAAGTAVAVGGRRKFGGGGAAAAAAAAAANGGDDDDVSDLDSDDAEDAEAKAERLGRRTKESAAAVAAAASQAAGRGKKGRKGAVAVTAPPTAADEADLDAAIAAGAAGRGLLVASSDAGVDLGVVRQDGGADDADAERRKSGHAASTRAGGKAGKGKDILGEVAAQQASLAAGGGRAALFEGAAGAAAAAGGAAGVGAPPKFIAAKTFGGARSGYVFKKGAQGLGYYWDAKAAAAAGQLAGAGPGAGGAGKDKSQQQQQRKDDGVKIAGTTTQKQQPQQQQQSKKGKQQQQAEAVANGAAAATAAAAAAGAGDDDEEEDAPMMRPADTGAGQRDLIRQAFAGDDVEAEFAEEKAAAVAAELPNVEEPSALPGWGAWAAQQRNPRWMQAAKDKAAKIRADAAAGRKDANLKYVVVSEKWDKKAAKYTAPTAPFPFTNQETYERSLRQPLGRDFNPDAAFRDLTRPAVLKQSGVTIAPLRYSEPAAKQLGKRGRKAEAEREGRRVMTVAGGMVRAGGGGGGKKKKQ